MHLGDRWYFQFRISDFEFLLTLKPGYFEFGIPDLNRGSLKFEIRNSQSEIVSLSPLVTHSFTILSLPRRIPRVALRVSTTKVACRTSHP